jgi:type IV secretion system protein TrbE
MPVEKEPPDMAVYTEFLPKRRWFARHCSDVMPWRAVAAPGVILQKQTHALQRTYLMRGPDLSSEVQEVQGALMLQANNVFKRLGGAWTVHCEAQRVPATAYPEGTFPAPAAALIDDERRHTMLVEPGSFETHYYLTLTWQQPGAVKSFWTPLLVSGASHQTTPQLNLSDFLTQSDYLIYLLRGMLTLARPLTTDETLTYLHNCVSDRWHPVRFPELPIDVDVMVCDTPFTGGWYPQLGRYHLRVCSVQSYPARSVANALQAIDHLRFPYRWSTRWIAYPRQSQDYLLARVQKQWVGQEKGALTRIGELMSKKDARVINTTATNKAEDVDEARQEVGADIVAFGDFTATVMVWDEDSTRAEEKLRDVMQILDSRGFVTIQEREHATAAWLSSMPGNRADSVRRTPHHSLTFAHLAPGLAAAWTGPARDEHLDGPPWFLAHTEGSTLFRVVNHVLDNGHFMVLGPTRSGKSVSLAFMVAQWFRYPGAQAFPFDVDLSMRCLTLCLGGLHYDIGAGTVRLQPLRYIDQPMERAWAGEWLLQLLHDNGVEKMAGLNSYIDSALDKLASGPVAQRTLTELRYACKAITNRTNVAPGRPTADGTYVRSRWQEDLLRMGSQVQDALEPFIAGSRLGHVLDHDMDDLSQATARLITFEQRTLLALPKLIGPTMQAVFHRLEGRFDTRTPTLIPMDEWAVTAAIADFAEQGKEWLMTRAKKNVSLGFATHSLVQIFGEENNALGALMLEGCQTKFVLPNPAARTPQMAAIYHKLGFNDAEIKIISSARPQRDIYYASELSGKRLYTLQLSPALLAMLARNRQEDHELMDEILREHGPEAFPAQWLEAQGFPEHAARLRAGGTMMEDVA